MKLDELMAINFTYYDTELARELVKSDASICSDLAIYLVTCATSHLGSEDKRKIEQLINKCK